MKLVIVESPTKAKTLAKFLGKGYEVGASMGHIRDLPKKEFGINERTFEPKYVTAPKARKVASDIKKKAEESEAVFLATDPDREGEAIAWHLLSLISDKKKQAVAKRVVFHEITQSAVEEAFNSPRTLDKHLVDSQQARRVLDRIVGYKLSPLLWKKVRYGLSAGRVQSAAVRLVVDREEERAGFKPEEYWSFEGAFENSAKEGFGASLVEVGGKKLKVSSTKEAGLLKDELTKLCGKKSFIVSSVEKTEKKRRPVPPFTTSLLQQAAGNRLGFSAKRTMGAAQKLFEQGFITYHRTDSFNLASSFIQDARKFIGSKFGDAFLPAEPNFYKTRSKAAQEAHEAIRPTNLEMWPGRLKGAEIGLGGATPDEKKLYELIWKRAVSCQMKPAVFDQTAVLIDSTSVSADSPDKRFRFKAIGSKIKFEGWLSVYGRSAGDDGVGDGSLGGNGDAEKEASLPSLREKEGLDLTSIDAVQHFTGPPSRYTEASLIKDLEEDGIGRPSTYAPIISTIQERGYVKKENKQLVPQDVGVVVTRLLKEHFPEIVDFKFTATIEEELDKIAAGELEWVPVVRDFYKPFVAEVEAKESELSKKDMTLLEVTTEKCSECGKNLVVKLGKYGRFLSCSGFPECKYATPAATVGAAGNTSAAFEVDTLLLGKCPECKEGDLIVREGRFGKFVACGTYPKCKFTKAYLDRIGMKCPKCGDGEVIIKRGGRFGKIFYGCSNYPKCKFVSGKDPRIGSEV